MWISCVYVNCEKNSGIVKDIPSLSFAPNEENTYHCAGDDDDSFTNIFAHYGKVWYEPP